MVDGCLDWQANGLLRPPVVTNATAEYFDEQDLFGQWLDEGTEKRSNRVGERSTKLYSSWKNFAKSAGDDAGTLKMFRDNMRQHGYAHSGHLPGDNNGTGFVGISLKIQEDRYQAYAE